MDKKESYRHMLPHFQQTGQAYFVTWSLIDAIPPKALEEYTLQLRICESNIKLAVENNEEKKLIAILKMQYATLKYKYVKAYEDVLHLQSKSIINLSKHENTTALLSALEYWNGKRLENYAICIMNNHVHWVFRLYNADETGLPVYLQDILKSVKQYSANKINRNEGRKGTVWQKESWDTTIRNHEHLYHTIEYTINNPVKAGLVTDWRQWPGTVLYNQPL